MHKVIGITERRQTNKIYSQAPPLTLEQTADLKEAFTESDLPWKVDIVDWASTQDHFKKIIAAEKIIVQAGMKGVTSSLIETPSPQPSPKGRGSENQGTLPKKEIENVPESASLLPAAPLKERNILSPLPLGDKHLLSPLPLGEGQGEGQSSSKSIPTHIIQLAKSLRNNQTNAESFIWKLLRNRNIANAKFRRQHPIENYIADFYCHEHKLIVELDGSQHFTEEGMQKDTLRSQQLHELGISVLRFDNRQVFLETEAVLQVIYDALKNTPSPQPSPKKQLH